MTHEHPDGTGREPVEDTLPVPAEQPTQAAGPMPAGRPAAPGYQRPAGHLSPLSAGATATVWSLRTVAAAAVTAVALSGLGGAALAAASDGSSSQSGTGGRGFGGPPGLNGQFRGQVPGQNGLPQVGGTGQPATGSASTSGRDT